MENLTAKELYEQGPLPGQSVAAHVARLYAAAARERRDGAETLPSIPLALEQAGGELALEGYCLTYVDQRRPAA